MNRTKLIYFLSAFVLIIGCYALNQSYSMFVQTDTINNIDSVVPTLSYGLGDSNLTTEKIIVKGGSNDIVKIKLNNNGTTDIKYVLSLVEKLDGVSVQLLKLNGNDTVGTLSSNNSKYVWFRIINSNLEDKEVNFSLFGTYYTLNINEELLSKTNIDLNNLFDVSIKDSIIINAINASLDKNLNNRTLYNDGTILNIDDRSQLLSTEDDYTETTGNMSYYFNGNVIDNYINFANKCWRIVRIDGDNNIKLILEDIDNVCEESNGNYDIPINSVVLNEESLENNEQTNDEQKVLYNGTYGYKINENGQVLPDYLNSELEDITMSSMFKKFQTELTEYLSYMKVGNWCIDSNIFEEIKIDDVISYQPVVDLNNNYATWKKMYYGSYVNINNNQVSLKCNGENISKFNDNIDMYVGTLNASEVILAGINENNYLMNKYSLERIEEDNTYSGINFWTLSPSYFDGLRSYAYGVDAKGNLVSVDLLDTSMFFRPSINLRNINIVNGDGTKGSPYTILEESVE